MLFTLHHGPRGQADKSGGQNAQANFHTQDGILPRSADIDQLCIAGNAVDGVAADRGVEEILERLLHFLLEIGILLDGRFVGHHSAPLGLSVSGQVGQRGRAACRDSVLPVLVVRSVNQVGGDPAGEAPFVPSDVSQQTLVAASPCGTDAVEGSHDAHGLVAFQRSLEAAQFRFTARLLCKVGGHAHTVHFLVVESKVLDLRH